jgi:hypothetical protein
MSSVEADVFEIEGLVVDPRMAVAIQFGEFAELQNR